MRAADNDYTAVERSFAEATGQDLCLVDPHAPPATGSLSVVVVSYNGHRTLPVTLAALQAQRYRDFEVIVVDDGSAPDLGPVLDESDLDVPITLVRTRNGGQARARNLGIGCAGADCVVLLDDDIRTPPGMTHALALRHRYTRNCVFVGFRETVHPATFADPGGRRPDPAKDWRWHSDCPIDRYLLVTAEPNIERPQRQRFELLAESDRFRWFGHGRVIGFWDLPGMVAGHSICVPRAELLAVGGFAERRFTGWGAEDLALGAALIARGNLIVPALDWTSFHPRHEGRRTSRTDEMRELQSNIDRYRAALRQPHEPRPFPGHHLRRLPAAGRITRYEAETAAG